MKLVIAYVRPNMLDRVLLALHDIHLLSGVSVGRVRGFGRGRARNADSVAEEGSMSLLSRVRLEAVCTDETLHEVVSKIEQNAHTGRRGDGKIYVLGLEDAVRISTGERGAAAL